uniref:Integrase, catalytic region, zinc finger, CCHC-type, peptidase aspartic, catalytic n=1 Tax=Tanacetum cinerariifolium TaxID=118510 RepID=A0A6L2MP92_TANCI|nr:hypothetical protein [Tanacetum cinerariifolium]
MPNPEDIIDPTTAINMALALMAKAFKLNYSTSTNNNQRISSNPRNRQIAQLGMNMGQDRQMQMVRGNGENQFRQYAGQNVRSLNRYNDVQNVKNQVIQNAVQNLRVHNIRNQNGLIGVPGNANHNLNGNGNLVAARAEGNATGHNGNQIRCYNCRGEEARIQLQAEEFDLMAGATDLDEIKEVNANYILMANLQEALTSGTQTDKAPVYDSDGSAEYTELLEPIPESHQVPQNDNNVISEVTSMEQSGGTVEQHSENVKETRALYDSLYHNLAIKVEKVNTVNHLNKQLSKEKSTVSFLLEEKKKLKFDFKIHEDELHDKKIQLEKRINELNNILVKIGQSIQMIYMLSPNPDSFYHTEQKMDLGYQNPFYLKQAQKKKQSLYDGKVLLEKHDPPTVYDSEETLQLAQESRLKMKQLNKEIKLANYTKINHLSGVFVSQTAKSHEELYFSNNSKTAEVSEPISIPNEEFLDDTTPSVARKFLNEEAAKFVGDFKSLAKEADEFLAKHKELELEIERLLKAVENEYAKLWNDWYKKCEECKFDKIAYDKAYNDMQQKIERLQAQLGDLKGKRKPPKLDETHALSNPVTTNLTSTPHESKVVKNDKVITPGMFRINPFKTSREEKHVPNTVRASARTKPITVSQPHVFTKKVVVQLCLWCVDSGCSKHMTGNLKLLINFVWKFLAIVRFRNDHVAAILGFGKSKGASHPPKSVPNSRQRLHLLHMDLCGPMRIDSINGKRKQDISFLHVFGALCYPKNDREDIRKLGAKAMAFEQRSSKPGLQSMTFGQINSGLDLTYALSTITTQQPTEGELALLFESMYDDYIGGQPSAAQRTISDAQAQQVHQTSTTSTSIADTAPTPTNSSSQATIFLNTSQDVDGLSLQQQ